MIKDKIIKIKLHGRNRRFYKEFDVKDSDEFLEVNQLRLSKNSTTEVECNCDNCNKTIYRKVKNVTTEKTYCSTVCRNKGLENLSIVRQENKKKELKKELIHKLDKSQSILYGDLKKEDPNFLWDVERYFGSFSNIFLEIGISQEEMISDYGFSRNINKRLLTYDEMKERLFHLKNIGRLTTSASRTEFEDGQRLERSVKIMFGGFEEGLNHFGLKRDIPESDELINGGRTFQVILKEIYEALGFKIHKYDKRINGIAPDFRMENGIWIDAKLSAWTPSINSTIDKYTPCCEKLIIVYMRGERKRKHENEKVSFKKIDEYFPHLVSVGREDLIERINLLEIKLSA